MKTLFYYFNKSVTAVINIKKYPKSLQAQCNINLFGSKFIHFSKLFELDYFYILTTTSIEEHIPFSPHRYLLHETLLSSAFPLSLSLSLGN